MLNNLSRPSLESSKLKQFDIKHVCIKHHLFHEFANSLIIRSPFQNIYGLTRTMLFMISNNSPLSELGDKLNINSVLPLLFLYSTKQIKSNQIFFCGIDSDCALISNSIFQRVGNINLKRVAPILQILSECVIMKRRRRRRMVWIQMVFLFLMLLIALVLNKMLFELLSNLLELGHSQLYLNLIKFDSRIMKSETCEFARLVCAKAGV